MMKDKKRYPEKEYIDIELIGVDLLQDLGIEALDHKLHIHKSKRPNAWVSELNGWTKTRIDYGLRPSSWQEYIADIDEIRTNVNDLIAETIKLIDDIYRKGRYSQDILQPKHLWIFRKNMIHCFLTIVRLMKILQSKSLKIFLL